jgi:hypothetical protein
MGVQKKKPRENYFRRGCVNRWMSLSFGLVLQRAQAGRTAMMAAEVMMRAMEAEVHAAFRLS